MNRKYHHHKNICKKCGCWFFYAMYHPRQKYCGSVRERSGCAYIVQQEQSRKWAKVNKEKHNKIHREWTANNLEKARLQSKLRYIPTGTKPIRDKFGRFVKFIAQ